MKNSFVQRVAQSRLGFQQLSFSLLILIPLVSLLKFLVCLNGEVNVFVRLSGVLAFRLAKPQLVKLSLDAGRSLRFRLCLGLTDFLEDESDVSLDC